MTKIEQHHVGQRYFVGEVWVDDRDIYHQTACYTTQSEAMAELECLAQECETVINRKQDRSIESVVREYEVKALDDDGTIGHAETVGQGVELVEYMTSPKTEAQQLVDEHPNAADLMQILSQTAYPSDQDWDRGQTTWTLDDGSQIRICGNDVEALAQS